MSSDTGAPQAITFQPDIYGKVLDLIPRDPQLRILDVGAGQGFLSRQLKDQGANVEACDFLEDNFRCADVPFHKANLNEGLPCSDDAYDLVVSVEVAEHIENHFRFMSELVRVTRPGGRIIVTTPNILSIPSRWYHFTTGFTDCAPVPIDPHKPDYWMEHINPISLPEILFHLEKNGADLVDLTTNRLRKSAWLGMALYPLIAWKTRRSLLKKRWSSSHELHRRHIRWMLEPANLMGRITIAVARKRP